MDLRLQVGLNVRAIRMEKGWTQEELAFRSDFASHVCERRQGKGAREIPLSSCSGAWRTRLGFDRLICFARSMLSSSNKDSTVARSGRHSGGSHLIYLESTNDERTVDRGKGLARVGSAF